MASIISKNELPVSDEEWETVCEFNREMVQDYLDNQTHLSDQTAYKYRSELRIYFVWVKNYLKNKECVNIKKKEFLRYINWLTNRGMSDSAIKLKKSSVSSLNKFIESFYEDEYPNFRNYVTSEMKIVKTGNVHEKEFLSEEELQFLYDELEKREEWQKLAYVKFSYSSGCRKGEASQLLKEVVNYTPTIKEVTLYDDDGKPFKAESRSYKTHDIRCKGRSKVGKVRKLQFSEDAMIALKKWIEVRGDDDCPNMFIADHKVNGKIVPITHYVFNNWCQDEFSSILGKRIHPHMFRRSRASNLVVNEHKNIEIAQKLLGHESSETTSIYVIREDTDDANEAFV